MPMKYYVRTTNERTLGSSYSQIEYELLVDTEHNARKSFVEQLEKLAELNKDCVILEDDLILCKDFKKRIEAEIKAHKTEVINFFYDPRRYFKPHYTLFFTWNQCVYYPKAVLKKLSVKMRELYEAHPDVPHDDLEGNALAILGIKTWLPRPCLVQHLDTDTLIHSRTDNRRTPYFIDYLDELGIKYEDALNIHNIKALNELLNDKFKGGK